MKIEEVVVKNYRLLRDFTLDLRDNLSLVVGKNNTGKTSVMTIMNKFLGNNNSKVMFHWHDFNISFQESFYKYVKSYESSPEVDSIISKGIMMRLKIKYSDDVNAKL